MLYAGAYDRYLIQIITDDAKCRVTLLRRDADPEAGTRALSSLMVNTTVNKNIVNNVVATGSISLPAKITQYAGDSRLLSKFIAQWATTEFYKKAIECQHYLGTEIVDGYTMRIELCNHDIITCSRFRELEYKNIGSVKLFDAAIREDKDFQEMQLGLLRNRLRTLQDLRDLNFDLSWYEDANKKKLKDYSLITEPAQMVEVLAQIANPENKFICVDTEFSNKDIYWQQPTFTRMFGMSISWKEDQAVYLVFESTKTETLDILEWLPVTVAALNASPNAVTVHNAFAEVKSCWNYSCLLNIDYDTLSIEFNINPEHRFGDRDLKTLARVYFHSSTVELTDIFNGRVIPELIPEFDPDVIEVYACADADFGRKTLLRQRDSIDINRASIRLDSRIISMLALAEYYGTHIDMELLPKLRELNKEDRSRLEFLAFKYLEEIGVRQQAILYLGNKEATENNISMIMADPQFKNDMKYVFSKGKISEEAFTKKDSSLRKLTLRHPDDKKILFTILQYPVTRFTPNKGKGRQISANVDSIDDLLVYTTNTPVKFLSGDVMSALAKTSYATNMPSKELLLLSKKKFEQYKYPFAYLLQEWRRVDKQETSFFATLSDNNTGGWYYTKTSMITARTARVTNAIQTLKKALKKLVVSFSDLYYLTIFDMSQIEFRVMLGISNNLWVEGCNRMMQSDNPMIAARGRELLKKSLTEVIDGLRTPYTDYHREGGSRIVGTTPFKMTSEQRNAVKPVHFSVPFGANAYSIAADKMREQPTAEGKQVELEKTEQILAVWRNEMYPLYWFLENVRDTALKPVPDEELPERLKGMNLGKVTNIIGRTRYMNLTPRTPMKFEVEEMMQQTGLTYAAAYQKLATRIEESLRASIRREAGNYPIQSYAREVFFSGMYRLFNALYEEGLTAQHRDFFKVLMSVFVHDECGCQVHRSVHPFKMYKLIHENCLTVIPGHPDYFMNIAIADNWAEGKDDEWEASVVFCRHCIELYNANPEYYDEMAYRITNVKMYVFALLKEHFYTEVIKHFGEHLKMVGGTIEEALDTFPVYYITQHLGMYSVALDKDVGKEHVLREQIKFCFAGWATERDLVLDGKTVDEWYQEYSERVESNRPNPAQYVADHDVIPRGDISHIPVRHATEGIGFKNRELKYAPGENPEEIAVYTSEFASPLGGIGEGATTGSNVSLGEVDLSGLNELGGLTDLGSEVPTLEGLLQSDAIFDEAELFREFEAGDTFTDKQADTIHDTREYEDMLDMDMDEQINAIIRNYLGSEEEMSEVKKEATIPARTIIFDGSITLHTSGIPKERVIAAVQYLAQFKSDNGYHLQTLDNTGIHQIGTALLRKGFSVMKVNQILNGDIT